MATKIKTTGGSQIRVAYLSAPTLLKLAVLVNQAVVRGAELRGGVHYLPRTDAQGERVAFRGGVFVQAVQWGRLERDLARMLGRLPELVKMTMNLCSGRNFPADNPPPGEIPVTTSKAFSGKSRSVTVRATIRK